MSAAELASAGRTPAGGGNPSSSNQPSFSNGAQPSKVSPFGGHPQNQNKGEQSSSPRGPPSLQTHGVPFSNLSRSGTPGGYQSVGRGGSQSGQRSENYAYQGPVLAAPRPVPPYPRFTSPQPSEGLARSPSPSKRSAPYSAFGAEGRERWASISQVQDGSGPNSSRAFDQPAQKHQSDRPSFPSNSGPGVGGSVQDSFLGYADVFGPTGPSSGGAPPGGAYHPMGREPRSAGYPGDRGWSTDGRGEDHNLGGHGLPYSARAGDAFGPFGNGPPPPPNGFGHPFGDHGALSPLPPSGSMSPRSMMQFHNYQMLAQQSAMHPPGSNGGGAGNLAHNLGSGLMSNSGQPAEEITTVFIVGFPDDMTERELANMFLFAKGFEASTLKVPAGGPTPGSGSMPPNQGAMGGHMAGPGGPYNAVNMPGGSMFDVGSAGGWDEQSINMALSRTGSNDPFSLASIGSSLGGVGSMPGATGPNGGKIKQIIGFAKFRTRAEALEARDALNGKKIDAERGCVLKTEMAKKNLHTKQKPVLPGPGGSLEGPFGGPFPSQQNHLFHPTGSEREGPRQSAHPGPFPSSFPPSGGQSFESFSRAAGPHSSTLSGMLSPHGVDMQHGPDYPGRTQARGGLDAPFSNVPMRTPSEAPQSAASEKWASVGPLDYFGPENDGKREEEYFRSHASSSATSHHSQPRGPDWSALGSPPGGLFSSSRSSGPDASRSSGGEAKAISGGNLTSPTKHGGNVSHSHDPPHYNNSNNNNNNKSSSKEDFGLGEPMTITTPTISQGQSQRRDTRSTTSGGSFSGSPSKAATTTNSTTCSSSHASTSPPSANDNHNSSHSTARMQEGKTASGMGSNEPISQAGTAFASRFGTLRLETPDERPKDNNSPNDGTSNRTNHQVNSGNATSPSSSGGPRSPIDLPSPTSRSFSIDQNPPGNTLFVGNLPGNMSASASSALEESLRERFSACSGYRQLSFRIKNNGTMCFVEFDDVQNAARALAEVNGDNMGGTVKNGGLRLSFSKNPLFRNSCSASNATIGGSSTPTPSSTNTASGSASQQHFASLGKASEHLRKQPSLSGPLSANAPPASTSHKSTGSTSSKGPDPLDSINTLEESAYKDGFSAGSSHGKLHGLFEGRQLGREKGFEIWDEVGFYEGTARFWKGVLAKQVESVPAHMRSRKQVKQLQHLSGLETLIAAFPLKNRSGAQLEPTPASMLAGMPEANGQSASTAEGEVMADDTEGLEEESAETLAQLDMSALLERIRARYKVVCASLGIPARGLEEGGDELAAEGDSTLAGTATPTGGQQKTNNKTSAVIGGNMVDTTQLRF